MSVKGVVLRDDRVLLLLDERDEWELPGGRLEPGETPQQCVAREIAEEVGWDVTVGALVDVWVLAIPTAGRDVVIVTYACDVDDGAPEPVVSAEHRRAELFRADELSALRLPDGYRRSITAVLEADADRRVAGPPSTGASAFFGTGSLLPGVQFAQAIAALADDLGEATEIDLSSEGVTVRLVDAAPDNDGGTELARQVSALARELDLPQGPWATPPSARRPTRG